MKRGNDKGFIIPTPEELNGMDKEVLEAQGDLRELEELTYNSLKLLGRYAKPEEANLRADKVRVRLRNIDAYREKWQELAYSLNRRKLSRTLPETLMEYEQVTRNKLRQVMKPENYQQYLRDTIAELQTELHSGHSLVEQKEQG